MFASVGFVRHTGVMGCSHFHWVDEVIASNNMSALSPGLPASVEFGLSRFENIPKTEYGHARLHCTEDREFVVIPRFIPAIPKLHGVTFQERHQAGLPTF